MFRLIRRFHLPPASRLYQNAVQWLSEQRSFLSSRIMVCIPLYVPLGLTALALLFAPALVPPLAALSHSPSDAPALSRVFTPGVLRWEGDIQRWSSGYGLDPNLVATVMQIESCGNPNAVSPAGARGLFQVMTNHFSAGEDPLNPEVNARRGLEYLSIALLQSGGDVGRTLAGYNGGLGLIGTIPSTWPRETQRYVYWGTGVYQEAQTGAQESQRLAEWLAAGGSNLCQGMK